MDKIYFQIAGFNICINFCDTEWVYIKDKLKKEILAYINSFVADKKPEKIDYQIDIVWEQELKLLYFKKEKTAYLKFYTKASQKKLIASYALSIVEFRKLLTHTVSELLIRSKGFLLHSSAAKIGNKADIFTGPSGAGKSTIASMLKDKYTILSDDISIVRKEGGKYYFYQTPFVDKAFWIKNGKKKYPLGRIFFLEKSKYFKIVKINDKERIIKQLLMLYEKHTFNNANWQKLVNNILESTSSYDDFYLLYFPKNRDRMLAGLRN